MTEIVMLVWLGDVAHNVSLMLGLLLLFCGLGTLIVLSMGGMYDYEYKLFHGLARPVVACSVISALALALIPSRDAIYLYAAARAVQIAETTELGSEVYAALLRSLREVSPAK